MREKANQHDAEDVVELMKFRYETYFYRFLRVFFLVLYKQPIECKEQTFFKLAGFMGKKWSNYMEN